MKRMKFFVLLFAAIFLFSGCNTNDISSNTELRFSFQTDDPTDFSQEKNIFIAEDLDELALDCSLESEGGMVSVEVVCLSDNQTAFEGRYEDAAAFEIVLSEIEENSSYLIKVNAEESEGMTLIITSEESLVEEKPIPSKE